MSEADKMFKKLGYIKKELPAMNYIEYIQKDPNNENSTLCISFNNKTVMCTMYNVFNTVAMPLAIELEELEAINEKCKELRLVMSEEVIEVLDKLIDKWADRVGCSGELGYNKDLDYMCCDLLDFKAELKKYVIKKIDYDYERY